MTGQYCVEVGSRWDAVSLLRLLCAHHAWTVQLADDRWLVVARADTDTEATVASGLVRQWGEQNGTAAVLEHRPSVLIG